MRSHRFWGPMAEDNRRLLIVDDNEMNRDILSRQLHKSGAFEVDTADHGSVALQMMRTTEYDLVLLDLMMPDITGMEVLQEIRKTKTPMQLPVILISANDQSENMVEAFAHGANDYVLKPIDFPAKMFDRDVPRRDVALVDSDRHAHPVRVRSLRVAEKILAQRGKHDPREWHPILGFKVMRHFKQPVWDHDGLLHFGHRRSSAPGNLFRLPF